MKAFSIPALNAAKRLAQLYRDLTCVQVENAFKTYGVKDVARALTGFGDTNECIICAIADTCIDCFYMQVAEEHCTAGVNEKTYRAIASADTPEKLYLAYKARMNYIQQLIERCEYEMDDDVSGKYAII
jgi:hypothetical protein